LSAESAGERPFALARSGTCACRNPALPVLVNFVALPAVSPPPILPLMRRLFLDPIFDAEAETPARTCDHPGCVAGGEFRAPKSRLELHDYHWFCLEHVRAYNSAWNYYAGMSDSEIEAEVRHDTVWQRPSWRLGARYGPGYAARIRDYFDVFSGSPGRSGDRGRRTNGRAREAAERALSAREQALAVFEIEPPFTPVSLKARYIALVKLHHPDAHGGDKAAEEKLKVVNQAYATLKASYFS
jgi:DnaJ domain